MSRQHGYHNDFLCHCHHRRHHHLYHHHHDQGNYRVFSHHSEGGCRHWCLDIRRLLDDYDDGDDDDGDDDDDDDDDGDGTW